MLLNQICLQPSFVLFHRWQAIVQGRTPAGGTDGALAFIEHSTTLCLLSIFFSKILEKDGNLGKPNQNCVSAIP